MDGGKYLRGDKEERSGENIERQKGKKKESQA
jgi:hypothetical protein